MNSTPVLIQVSIGLDPSTHTVGCLKDRHLVSCILEQLSCHQTTDASPYYDDVLHADFLVVMGEAFTKDLQQVVVAVITIVANRGFAILPECYGAKANC